MKKTIIICIVIILAFFVLSSTAKCESDIECVSKDEPEMIDRIKYYNENPEVLKSRIQHIIDAEWLATIADAVAPYSDDNCKIAVMDCISNRVRAKGFPNSIETVCSQKNQWQGYTKNSTFSEESLKLAKEYLKNKYTIRNSPIYSNMTYMRVSEDGLYFRSGWEVKNEILVSYYSE